MLSISPTSPDLQSLECKSTYWELWNLSCQVYLTKITWKGGGYIKSSCSYFYNSVLHLYDSMYL